jgi:hypothetical protein
MFEDEARFRRMSNPIRCWAPSGCRPEVQTHRVREHSHVFGSVSPQDGELISLILPPAALFNRRLQSVGQKCGKVIGEDKRRVVIGV